MISRHSIVLLGENTAELGGSEYLAALHGVVAGEPPACDALAERRLIDALLEAIVAGAVASAHDCSEGGLAVAVAESCMMDRDAMLGAELDLSGWAALPRRALLFGEAQGRVLVSTPDPNAVLAIALRHGVPARPVGTVGRPGGPLRLRLAGAAFEAPLAPLAAAWHDTIAAIMSASALPSAAPA